MTFNQITVMFENNAPYVIMTEATKKVQVSHWGNIAVDEHFAIENIGPKVKGQNSRYDFDMNGAGQNCLRTMNSEYPFYIKGMYIGDFIGNISTTNALRTATNVELEFRPRYPVCGGWKNDWNQGYSMPTRFHISESMTTADLFKLTMPFYHQYDQLLTEDYTVEITLPLGASNIKVSFN
jgi:oligosaccharyltransferase complex subunit alpha (ribophorin I)